MQTKFIKFTKFEVEKVWPLAKDLVQLACETNGAFDVNDIKDMCKEGAMQLWLVIDETDKVDTQIDTYVSTDGLLKLIDQGDNNYSASPESLSDGSYIVLKNAGKWNGLHRVKTAGTGYITLYTKCSDSSTVQQAFEKTPNLYYNVSALADESSQIDLPVYLSKALVYYIKAKVAEDAMEIEVKEYMMREFRKMVEKHESSKVAGPRRVIPGSHAIR